MPSEFTLYHNPRCSKSRAAFDLLEARGIKAEVVKYLDTPPDLATLKDIFAKLGLASVRGMMRVKDDLYKELGLDKPDLDNQALLERPILTTQDKAAIGRPLENIEALLD